MPKIKKPPSTGCKPFREGKQTKNKFSTKEYSTIKPLDLIHTDLVGLVRLKILQGDKYFIMLTNDYSRMSCDGFIKEK